ncbi:NAD(P)-binding protein [Pseudovirgaria hyperparasitica]|uniref:NAD(P)-binding protein n=1 Tax=Pseudovirgaria hyperparasitica TaxID=470096 RepID=A0A6A6WL78_9PEZI|nr:NAD(P)-binding protein [Pseudovirgaria hyperparasitica]KAF2762970.1 NAD(P)-binding protein [Pseudovirgaria hyperparasitica]
MAASEATAALKTFFQSSSFAVAGASSDTSKFGHKVFAWYLAHSLPVTPLNPSTPSITALSEAHPTVPSPSAIPDPTHTSLSIITPPKVTRKVLEEAASVGVPAVWLQPGSFDEEGMRFARERFGTVIGGQGGRGGEGWCVLVDGEGGLRGAGKL